MDSQVSPVDRKIYLDLIGKPFEYGGRGPKTYDCYGLIMELKRRCGIIIHDFTSTDQFDLIEAMIKEGSLAWEQCLIQPGAVLVFRILDPATHMYYGAHVGMVIADDKFIHTWEYSGGVCIERISRWKHRVLGAYEYRGK